MERSRLLEMHQDHQQVKDLLPLPPPRHLANMCPRVSEMGSTKAAGKPCPLKGVSLSDNSYKLTTHCHSLMNDLKC